ncbi:methanogenesis marker 17 protein [Methanobacterium alcaliphilum]|uniref:methanogenesis marker 17 protein n=1 Tax=Methanobacterium alcaliphilum TaxID=392018 RepID=UPI00200A6AF3|nr:methanogenesis marker 17 protein [Methanobacterium alcaliphilum]MCK9151256.1 methanogenesis marker 17 protein [Methanobacterium alcaliphilum]
MLVECYDSKGAEVYEMIVRQVLQDLQIARSVKNMQIFVDPREPVFIIAVEIEKTTNPVLIEDLADLKYDNSEKKVYIRIKDETYLPDLMKILWELEGREKISQPTRFEVIIDNPEVELQGITIYDPAKNLKRKIYDAIFRILPEGFRVIKDISKGNIVAMVCTDELLQDDWIEKGRLMVNELKDK